MTVIASSVTALRLVRKYKCPHCGSEQERVLPEEGASLECLNCLQKFSPKKAMIDKRKARKRHK